MRKKIFAQLMLISLIVAAFTVSLSSASYRRAFSLQTEENTAIFASTLGEIYSETPDISVLQQASVGNMRISLIAPDGEVLYDSESEIPMENHLDRPEIAEALKTGSGSDRRRSDTLGYNTYYHAVKAENGCVIRAAVNVRTQYTVFDRIWPFILAIVLFSMAIAALLSLLLTRNLVRPIEKMAENLEEIDESVPYPELRPFAMSIKRQQDAKKEVEELRRDFTANVSHELKTPLTSISGYAEMIENGMARPEDIRSFAERIRSEAARLLALIGDIIELSQLDSLKGTEDFTPVDLWKAVCSAADYLSFSARQYDVELETEGSSLYVMGSKSQLEELAYNLCDNAIRYNRPGGSVKMKVCKIDGRAAIIVSDTGIGIPPDKQARVFERFFRVDKSRSKKSGGTGLGLAIVKHICIRHNAEIRLNSTPNVGTEITILFAKEA